MICCFREANTVFEFAYHAVTEQQSRLLEQIDKCSFAMPMIYRNVLNLKNPVADSFYGCFGLRVSHPRLVCSCRFCIFGTIFELDFLYYGMV